jgi:hypothetical protein
MSWTICAPAAFKCEPLTGRAKAHLGAQRFQFAREIGVELDAEQIETVHCTHVFDSAQGLDGRRIEIPAFHQRMDKAIPSAKGDPMTRQREQLRHVIEGVKRMRRGLKERRRN